jgi:hypothetical protein
MKAAESEFGSWENKISGLPAREDGLKIFTLNQEDWLSASD